MATTRFASTWLGEAACSRAQARSPRSRPGSARTTSWPLRAEGGQRQDQPRGADRRQCTSARWHCRTGWAGPGPRRPAGHPGGRVEFTPGTGITGITLTVSGVVGGHSEAGPMPPRWRDAKANCPGEPGALRDHDHPGGLLASRPGLRPDQPRQAPRHAVREPVCCLAVPHDPLGSGISGCSPRGRSGSDPHAAAPGPRPTAHRGGLEQDAG